MGIKIVVSDDAFAIENYMADGYCPVGCLIDGMSYVDELKLVNTSQTTVLNHSTVRAYCKHLGWLEEGCFVVKEVNVVNMFCIAALSGSLATDYPCVEDNFTTLGGRLTKLAHLAITVARWDLGLIKADFSAPQGHVLLYLIEQCKSCKGEEGAWKMLKILEGVRDYLDDGSGQIAQEIMQFARKEPSALSPASELLIFHSYSYLRMLNIKLFECEKQFFDGFPDWFQRVPELGSENEANGWLTPIVMVISKDRMMLRCPNETVAEELFGPTGLYRVYGHFQDENNVQRDQIKFEFNEIDFLEARVFGDFDFAELGHYLFRMNDDVLVNGGIYANF